jgi:uncharacterized linocin/CFP29 family protein
MTANNPQLPWTDEQWARVNQVIQEEASRARVAATFLSMVGPLPGGTDFVRRELISYPGLAVTQRPPRRRIAIDDRNIWQLATLQVKVRLRGAQIADPEMTSAMALFRRAANVVARLEDAVVFRGVRPDPVFPGHFRPRGGVPGLQRIWEITGVQYNSDGLWMPPWLWTLPRRRRRWIVIPGYPRPRRGEFLVRAVSEAIGRLESSGHFGPFAVVLDQGLFLVAQSPDRRSLVLPQDRIIPFLGGGPLLRSSTLDHRHIFTGLVMALGGAPFELVVATDMCLQFLQVTADPVFLFRVRERMALRIKEPEAIIELFMWP